MSIHNINTLQNFEDLRYNTDLAVQTDGNLNSDYYVHALANLEQRASFKYANGIRYGILTYENDYIISKDSEESITPTSMLFPNDLTFDIYVNNVEIYKKYSQISDDGSTFRTMLFAKVLGSTGDEKNVEIQYTSIDLETHTIIEAYRAFPLSGSSYVMIHLNSNGVTNNVVEYKLKCFRLEIDKSNETILELFNSSLYDSAVITNSIINELNIDNIVDKLFTDNPKNEDDGIFIRFCRYSPETIENNYTLICEFDTNNEQLLKITDKSLVTTAYRNIKELLYFNYYNIDNYIEALNNDLSVVYPNMLKYYSMRQFNSNVEILKRIIANTLYDNIINEYYKDEIISEPNIARASYKMTIPAGTKITYVSNIENALQLYYTDDIYVFFISNDPTSTSIYTEDNFSNGIRFEYPGNDKTVIYNIYSKYNTRYDEFIDTLIVNKKYTLPYINDAHLWEINDNTTTVYASGESAGNPNILLLHTYINVNDSINTDDVNVDKLNRFDIRTNELKYEDLEIKEFIYNGVSTQYCFKIPKINKLSYDKLKYSNIIALSNVIVYEEIVHDNKTDTDKSIKHYKKTPSSVTTIWTINDEHDGYVCLKLNNAENPLSIENMLSLDTYTYEKFYEFGHINNVFDDLVAIKLSKYHLNGSDVNKNCNYFIIEQNDNFIAYGNTEGDNHYNIVDFKIVDSLSRQTRYSYATDGYYDSEMPKLMYLWRNSGDSTSKPGLTISPYQYSYGISQNVYTYTIERGISNQQQSDNIHISQYGASTLTTQHTTTNITRDAASVNNTANSSSTNISAEHAEFQEDPIEAPVSLYEYGTQIYEEYIPKSYVPIIKESDVMHLDVNTINRQNIYSFNKFGQIYYSYIGSSCNHTDKGKLIIGTHTYLPDIINLGSESLIGQTNADRDYFLQTRELDINLGKFVVNSAYSYVNSYTLNANNIIGNVFINNVDYDINITENSIYNDVLISCDVETIELSQFTCYSPITGSYILSHIYNDYELYVDDEFKTSYIEEFGFSNDSGNGSRPTKNVHFNGLKFAGSGSQLNILKEYINNKYNLNINSLAIDLDIDETRGGDESIDYPYSKCINDDNDYYRTLDINGMYMHEYDLILLERPLLIHITRPTYKRRTHVYKPDDKAQGIIITNHNNRKVKL